MTGITPGCDVALDPSGTGRPGCARLQGTLKPHVIVLTSQTGPVRGKILPVLSLHKYVCLIAALLLLTSPLMACVLPGLEMSPAEQDCCRHMAEDCGSMQMADSHSCCKKAPQAGSQSFQASKVLGPDTAQPSAIVTEIVTHASASAEAMVSGEIAVNTKSPPGRQTNLRI